MVKDRDSVCESLVCEVSCPFASTPLRKQNFLNTETEDESVQEEERVQEEGSCAKIDTCLTSEEHDPRPSFFEINFCKSTSESTRIQFRHSRIGQSKING